MEFITGLKQQEEAELEDLLKAEEGTTIILEGAVHSIRDMGEIAFVILRKREGRLRSVSQKLRSCKQNHRSMKFRTEMIRGREIPAITTL